MKANEMYNLLVDTIQCLYNRLINPNNLPPQKKSIYISSEFNWKSQSWRFVYRNQNKIFIVYNNSTFYISSFYKNNVLINCQINTIHII